MIVDTIYKKLLKFLESQLITSNSPKMLIQYLYSARNLSAPPVAICLS